MTRVALIQLDVNDTETPRERIERAGAMVEGLVDVDLAVLPELWHVGAFDLDAARENAEPMDGAVVTRMRAAARRRPGSGCTRARSPSSPAATATTPRSSSTRPATSWRRTASCTCSGGRTASPR